MKESLTLTQIIQNFAQNDLLSQSLKFFNALGYTSERRIEENGSPETFLENYDAQQHFSRERGLFAEWQKIYLLFQLTDNEIKPVKPMFQATDQRIDNSIIESFLFIALELKQTCYSRTDLAKITRAINQIFAMPAILLFKHGETLTLSVIQRRLHKRDDSRDVLEKVTVLKDIRIANPHRAHLDILTEFALTHLKPSPTHFVELFHAWRAVLDTKELNKKFYKELSQWYFWASKQVIFPNPEQIDLQRYHAQSLIRLLTRLLFVWFVKEKQLVPDELFEKSYIEELLQTDHPSRYYRAILQNLFFATLNQIRGQRQFRRPGQNMNVTNLMRYRSYFKNPEQFLTLLENVVPFMNGGLFECLDKPIPDKKGKQGGDVIAYYDGFSDREDNILAVPDFIFFGRHQADLSDELGNSYKSVEIKGLIDILQAYKFTVAENTPLEEDVALDPELLGQVFENLLASYNPETGETARKATGSYYTPREIVDYMVDESLVAYFAQAGTPDKLRVLFNYATAKNPFNPEETQALITAIDHCKILDPACGSGAFPMGVLHKLVHALHQLDPQNCLWKERQLEKAQSLDDVPIREQLINDIETAFENNELDYGRKLYLIENCIYGVDIQPIAVQISKLRFFISLIVEQKVNAQKDNFGIRPLPNLETKFVAANTLIGIKKPEMQGELLRNSELEQLEIQLKEVRHRSFSAKTPSTKRKLRDEDKALREKIGELLEKHGFEHQTALQLAQWNPYDQNASADFFDSEWMFGIKAGFDVILGNPPYGANYPKELKKYFQDNYESAKTIKNQVKGSLDTFSLFIDMGLRLCSQNAVLSYIVPMAITSSESMTALHRMMFRLCETIYVSSFSERPKKIFDNVEYPVSILIALKKDKPLSRPGRLFTTKVNKRYKDSTIGSVIRNLEFVESSAFVKDGSGRLPKIGTLIEPSILAKLMDFKITLKDLMKNEGSTIFYKTAGGRYYKIITSRSTGSTQEKCFYVNAKYQNLVVAILSSNLYFWFYHVYSDNLHIKSYELEAFPIPIDCFSEDDIRYINELCKLYITDLWKNSRIKKANYATISEYREFYARFSKPLIDKIDLAIQKPYGLSDDEINFIINYDLKFRIDDKE